MIKLPGIFSKFPDDISNEIFVFYWKTEFYNVVKEIKCIIENCNNIVNSISKFNDIEYTNQKFNESIINNRILKEII